MRLLLAAMSALALLAAQHPTAIAHFESHASVLLPGSRFSLNATGIVARARVALIGTGRIDGDLYVVPSDAPAGEATLIAADASSLAVRTLRIAAPPRVPVLAVASYDDGIAFHRLSDFHYLGTLATGGSPSDVAAFGSGSVAVTDTDGTMLTMASLAPWSVQHLSGILLGDEIADDAPLHALFVTERDLGERGGLARVIGDRVSSLVTGSTAEGIALDARRQRVYVADTNGGDIAIVDARRMRVIGRIGGIPRAFSLAISSDGTHLYAVSNQGSETLFAAAGRVTEIAIDGSTARIVARSADLQFPVGVALAEREHEVFVTDEAADAVDVLDERTLRMRHAPLPTCDIPWKPALDDRSDRLYIPCAGSNEVDAVDARTLHRVEGAPFRTGGYPLAVAVVR